MFPAAAITKNHVRRVQVGLEPIAKVILPDHADLNILLIDDAPFLELIMLAIPCVRVEWFYAFGGFHVRS